MQKSSEIRQFQIDRLIKAPLATFDTVDLGDELPKTAVCSSLKSERPDLCGNVSALSRVSCDSGRAGQSEIKSEKPNQQVFSKELHAQKSSPVKKDGSKTNSAHEDNEKQSITAKNISSVNSAPGYRDRDNEEGFENYVYISHIPAADLRERAIVVGTKKPTEGHSVEGRVQASSQPITKIEPPPPPTLLRTSSFSSSSSDSDSDVRSRQVRVRRALRVRTRDTTDRIKDLSPITLSPEIVDPATITSPSKRKAYEKRLQRLQVKTSPIARPRSTTPINVVTLDEYVVLSSPEKSPNSPSVAEKLKITLPPDEFCVKARSPRKQWTKNSYEEDCCFEFNEELLFSHTRSALLVTEGGKLPDSPRRVLIPPTISPSSSPKLASAAKLRKDLDGVPGSPKLVYIQSPDNENWATFPDTIETKVTESDNCQTTSSTTSDNKNKSSEGDSSNPVSYANESIANSCDISNEEEEILTINIDSSGTSGKCGIDIVLSSSGSSNIPSPSTPEKPPTETPLQSQNGETRGCKESLPITITPSPTKEEELVEKVLSSSPRETFL